MVVGRGSWVVGTKSWVLGRGSWKGSAKARRQTTNNKAEPNVYSAIAIFN